MQVMLRPDQEAFVRRQMEAGDYRSAEEVVEEALRLLEDEAKLRFLRAEVAEADDAIARGEYVEWKPGFMERLQQKADEENRLGLPIDDAIKPA